MTHSIYIFSFYDPVTRQGPRKVCKPKLKLTMPNCPTRVKLGRLGGRKAPPTEKCVFFDAHLLRLKPRLAADLARKTQCKVKKVWEPR